METMQNMLDMHRIVENGPRRNAIHQRFAARAVCIFAPQLRPLEMWRCHHLTVDVTLCDGRCYPLRASVSGVQWCCWWPSSCGLSLRSAAIGQALPGTALHLDLQQRQLSLWWAPTTHSTITSPSRPDDESSLPLLNGSLIALPATSAISPSTASLV